MYYQKKGKGNRSKETMSMPVMLFGAMALVSVFIIVLFMTISRASQPGRDTLVVGTSTGFPPFEMRFGEEVRGLDLDLCEKIAKSLDRKMIVRDLAFDALLPSLGRGAIGEKPLVDIVCAAATRTNARDEVADFSDTYFVANQAILTIKDANIRYSSPEDLAGLSVAYQEGTTSQDWFEKNISGKIAVSKYASFTEMVVALQRLGKDFDAIIIDEPVARAFVKSRANLVIAGVIETGEEYGFVVAEGDPQGILPVANKTIAAMRESGEYDQIMERWFAGNEK